jgi:hypothetical protein
LFGQLTPDSLNVYYIGEKWFKWEEDTSWTITIDTLLVTDANEGCHCNMEGLIYNGENAYHTDYSFCYGNLINWYKKFYCGDSLRIVYDDISQPPPNVHYFSIRFYAKKSDMIIGIDGFEVDKTLIKISPNPYDDELIIEPESSSKKYIVELLNLQGVVLLSNELHKRLVLQTDHLTTGIYLLKISSGTDVFIHKVIKQ